MREVAIVVTSALKFFIATEEKYKLIQQNINLIKPIQITSTNKINLFTGGI